MGQEGVYTLVGATFTGFKAMFFKNPILRHGLYKISVKYGCMMH